MIRVGREFLLVKDIKLEGEGNVDENSKKKRYQDIFVRECEEIEQ